MFIQYGYKKPHKKALPYEVSKVTIQNIELGNLKNNKRKREKEEKTISQNKSRLSVEKSPFQRDLINSSTDSLYVGYLNLEKKYDEAEKKFRRKRKSKKGPCPLLN